MKHECYYCRKTLTLVNFRKHLGEFICMNCKYELTKNCRAVHHVDGDFENNNPNNLTIVNYRDIEEIVAAASKENPLISWLNQ